MKGILYGQETNKIVTVFDKVLSIDKFHGTVSYIDDRYGKGSAEGIDFNHYEIIVVENSEEKMNLGEILPSDLIDKSSEFEIISDAQKVRLLEQENSDMLLALMNTSQELNLVREEMALFILEVASKGGSL